MDHRYSLSSPSSKSKSKSSGSCYSSSRSSSGSNDGDDDDGKCNDHYDDNDDDECFNKPGLHMCLVFEKLGLSLFAFLSQNDYKGFFIEDVRKISYEVLKALAFLNKIGLTHTDLKVN